MARTALRRAGMLRGGETVLTAVSGGADSVALADVLVGLAGELRVSVHLVHVNHGLRPEAGAEQASVERLAGDLGVPCHVERVTVRREPPWEGLEAEARRARYGAFRAVAERIGAHRIATAHTADDQAETVLMRLLEGAGPRGLAGIAPIRGLLIRPLLEARRADIEAHLRARGLAWMEDASNRDPRFLRNRVRHDVLPFLERSVDPGIAAGLARSAGLVRALMDDLERAGARELPRLGRQGGAGWVFGVADLRALPREVAAETLRAAAMSLGHSGAMRGAGQRALRRLLAPDIPRGLVSAGGLAIEKSGRWLRVGRGRLADLEPREFAVPGALPLPEIGAALEARCFAAGAGYVVPRDADTVAFDADRIPSRLTVRARRRGDRFMPWGGAQERRLKSFLIDAGVPRWERARVPLLEADGDVIWVAGLRRGQAAPVGPGTTRILEVTLGVPLVVASSGR
jgi:tRNA(Ile)-lysidine synthase